MPSSRIETGHGPSLPELTRRYDQAYEALVRDDLDRVTDLLAEAADLLRTMRGPAVPGTAATRRAAVESQGRLLAGLQRTLATVDEERGRIRRALRVLQGYSACGRQDPGRDLESRL